MSSIEIKDPFKLYYRMATISLATESGNNLKSVTSLLEKGEKEDLSQLDLRTQGFLAGTYNYLLVHAENDEARANIQAEFASTISPQNLKWLNEHQKLPPSLKDKFLNLFRI